MPCVLSQLDALDAFLQDLNKTSCDINHLPDCDLNVPTVSCNPTTISSFSSEFLPIEPVNLLVAGDITTLPTDSGANTGLTVTTLQPVVPEHQSTCREVDMVVVEESDAMVTVDLQDALPSCPTQDPLAVDITTDAQSVADTTEASILDDVPEIDWENGWIVPTEQSVWSLKKNPAALAKLDQQEEETRVPIEFVELRKHPIRFIRSSDPEAAKAPFTERFNLEHRDVIKAFNAKTRFECPHCLGKFEREGDVLYTHACQNTLKADTPSKQGGHGVVCLVCNTFVFGMSVNNKYFHAKRHHQDQSQTKTMGPTLNPTQLHQCPFCPRAHKSSDKYRDHINSHTRTSKACPKCPFRTGSHRFMKQHVDEDCIGESRLIECEECGYACFREVDMDHHRMMRHGVRRRPDQKLGHIFDRVERIKRFNCLFCRFASTKESRYLRHMFKEHNSQIGTDPEVKRLRVSVFMSFINRANKR